MKKLDFVLSIAVLLLSSCSKGSFDLYSLKADRIINAKVDSSSDIYELSETLEVKARFSTDERYSFIISYPELDIRYEGDIRNGESAILPITPGAHFRAGEYKVILSDENGNDKDASFVLPSYDLENHPYFDAAGERKGDENASLSFVDKDGNIISSDRGTVDYALYDKAIFTYRDRYGTSITLEEVLSSPSNEFSEPLL